MTQLNEQQLAIAERLMTILYPYARKKRWEVGRQNGRFVHYTSAENALNIIRNRCIWMRNTTCMSDYREIAHGLDALHRYFAVHAHRKAFDDAVNACFPELAEETLSRLSQSRQANQFHTYTTSISEHDNREDTHGRLSMWRAFGNSIARVAIVIRLDMDIGKNVSLGAELSPVAYFNDNELAFQLNQIVANIKEHQGFLRGIERQAVQAQLQGMLAGTAICLKHEGFHEEREWRVIHSPARHVANHIQSSIEVIGGLPQRICKIPLRSNPEAGLTGLDPDEMIDRVIIGPTQYQAAMFDAFVSVLTEAGVREAVNRVVISQIPVRT
jgi:hypothetical protein